MIEIEEQTIMYFKKFHVLCFALFWIYVLSYPLIDKVFKLRSSYIPNYELTYEMIWTSSIPIINTAALIVMIKEDIDLYKKNKRSVR